jgi:hypothetical protein
MGRFRRERLRCDYSLEFVISAFDPIADISAAWDSGG